MSAPSVLILKADRLYAEMLRHSVLAAYPAANCILVNRIAQVHDALFNDCFDVFITGTSAPDGDVIDLLSSSLVQKRAEGCSVLVVTTHRELRLLMTLRALRVAGVFDPLNDRTENMALALAAATLGRGYWSPSVEHVLTHPAAELRCLRQLTVIDQLMLSVLGDGSDNEAASEFLGMRLSTVRAARRSLYLTLHVHDKWGLVHAAARHGFVRLTASGVIRIGFRLLLVAYQSQTQRPVPLTPALVATYPEAAAAAARRRGLRKVQRVLTAN